MSKLADEMELKDATAILARIIERNDAMHDALARKARADGVAADIMLLSIETENAALNLAMATMRLARGRIEEAADAMGVTSPSAPAPSAPKPAPVMPCPQGAEVEPAPRLSNAEKAKANGFRPAPVPPRTRAAAPEISF